jgi:hypothetical protein
MAAPRVERHDDALDVRAILAVVLDRPVDRLEDLFGRVALRDVEAGSRLEHRQDRLDVVERGERHDARVRRPREDLARRAEAAAARHAHVHQRDVRPVARGQLDRRLRFLRGTDEAQAGIGRDHGPEHLSDLWFVLCDQDVDRVHHALPPRSRRSWVARLGITRSRVSSGWATSPHSPFSSIVGTDRPPS